MEPDWTRERLRRFWDPSRQLLRSIRGYQAASNRPLARRWWTLSHRFWAAVSGAEIPLSCRIGGGLSIPHPNGIVINPHAVIGINCMIMHQVTLGRNGPPGSPVIGDGVDIGPGAKVLGPVTVGDGAIIGAMALVLRDIPPDAVAVGVPARSTGRSAIAVRAGIVARIRAGCGDD